MKELPFKCKFCGKLHDSEHRLPESHNCEGLVLWKKRNLEKIENGKVVMFSDINEKKNNEKDLKETKVSYMKYCKQCNRRISIGKYEYCKRCWFSRKKSSISPLKVCGDINIFIRNHKVISGIILMAIGLVCFRISSSIQSLLGDEAMVWWFLISLGLFIAGILMITVWWRNNVLTHNVGFAQSRPW